MCELGTTDSDWVMTDSWESQQKEYQRTIVVLEHFHHQLNEHLRERYQSEIRALFLCGADLVESFAKPGVWADEDVCQPLGPRPHAEREHAPFPHAHLALSPDSRNSIKARNHLSRARRLESQATDIHTRHSVRS